MLLGFRPAILFLIIFHADRFVFHNKKMNVADISHTTMNRLNPITEDHKLLLVFRNIGLKLLQQLRDAMYRSPYNSFFKDVPAASHEARFSYLGHQFTTA